MDIEFDHRKDAINIAKHGISLILAKDLNWNSLWATIDNRFDYGETRWVGYAYLGSRLYCVVYTNRRHSRRIISLRKANKREVIDYVHNNEVR